MAVCTSYSDHTLPTSAGFYVLHSVPSLLNH